MVRIALCFAVASFFRMYVCTGMLKTWLGLVGLGLPVQHLDQHPTRKFDGSCMIGLLADAQQNLGSFEQKRSLIKSMLRV